MLSKKSFIKRSIIKLFNFPRSSIDDEIESLYSQITEREKIGLDPRDLFLQNRKTITYIKYIMEKMFKTELELYIIKVYLSTLSKFISILSEKNALNDQLLTKIAKLLRCEQYPKDYIICRQGDKGERFFIVLQGSIDILIRKEVNATLTIEEYLKYLVLLNVYNENDLINKILLANRDTICIEEKDLMNLFTLFRVFKFFKDNNSSKVYKTFTDFFNGESQLCCLLKKKFDYHPSHCLGFFEMKENEIILLYEYYEQIYNEAKRKQNFSTSSLLTKKIRRENTTVYFKDEIYSKVISNTLRHDNFIYSATTDEYTSRIKQYNIATSKEGKTLNLYNLAIVTTLTEGNVFGDYALQHSSKKRTATIITKSDCIFGTLSTSAYNQCIKSSQEKVHQMNINFFLNGPIFKNINQIVFESRFFNMFIQEDYSKGDILIKTHSQRSHIFFIKTGEIEVYSYMTFTELNFVIKSLGGVIEDLKEIRLYSYEYGDFNNLYNNTKHLFKICLLKEGQIAGLDDMCLNGKFFCDCICYSNKVKAYKLEKEFYSNLLYDGNIRRNIVNYVDMKRRNLVQRLLTLRKNMISNIILKLKEMKEEKEKSCIVKYKCNNNKNMISFYKPEVIGTNTIRISRKGNSKLNYKFGKNTITNIKTEREREKERVSDKANSGIIIANLKKSKDNKNIMLKKEQMIPQLNLNKIRKLDNSFMKSNYNSNGSNYNYYLRTIQPSLPLDLSTEPFRKRKEKVKISTLEKTFNLTNGVKRIKTYRMQKVFLSEKRKGNSFSLKEYKTKFGYSRNVTLYDSSVYKTHLNLFDSIIHDSSPSKIKNKGVIDCLVLDKWAENLPVKDLFE